MYHLADTGLGRRLDAALSTENHDEESAIPGRPDVGSRHGLEPRFTAPKADVLPFLRQGQIGVTLAEQG
jgi:hypothetical protein